MCTQTFRFINFNKCIKGIYFEIFYHYYGGVEAVKINTLNILESLRSFTKNMSTIGVFPSNKLPNKIKKPAFIVANTDPANKPGEHWVAFYFPLKGQAEYFDSFGQAPCKRNFTKFLEKNSSKYIINNRRFQGNFSSTCGNYCCLFLYFRSMGKSLKQFSNKFSPYNFESNDVKVVSLFNKCFKKTSRTQTGGLKCKNKAVCVQCCKSMKGICKK